MLEYLLVAGAVIALIMAVNGQVRNRTQGVAAEVVSNFFPGVNETANQYFP